MEEQEKEKQNNIREDPGSGEEESFLGEEVAKDKSGRDDQSVREEEGEVDSNHEGLIEEQDKEKMIMENPEYRKKCKSKASCICVCCISVSEK